MDPSDSNNWALSKTFNTFNPQEKKKKNEN